MIIPLWPKITNKLYFFTGSCSHFFSYSSAKHMSILQQPASIMSVTRVCCSGRSCWEGQLKDTSLCLHRSLLSPCRSTGPWPKLCGSAAVLQHSIILFSGSWETLRPKCWVLLQENALTVYINSCTISDTTSCHFVPACCWQPIDYKNLWYLGKGIELQVALHGVSGAGTEQQLNQPATVLQCLCRSSHWQGITKHTATWTQLKSLS